MDLGAFKASVGRILAIGTRHNEVAEALRSLQGCGHPTGQRWRFVRSYVTDGTGFLGRKRMQAWESFLAAEILEIAEAGPVGSFSLALRQDCPHCGQPAMIVANDRVGDPVNTDFWVLCLGCVRLTMIGSHRAASSSMRHGRVPSNVSRTDVDTYDDDDDL